MSTYVYLVESIRNYTGFMSLQHQQGVLSMANYGRPHSNNSQFFITAVESTHLDGSNVVFGRILKGFGIIGEMEKFTDDEAVPSAVSIFFT